MGDRKTYRDLSRALETTIVDHVVSELEGVGMEIADAYCPGDVCDGVRVVVRPEGEQPIALTLYRFGWSVGDSPSRHDTVVLAVGVARLVPRD